MPRDEPSRFIPEDYYHYVIRRASTFPSESSLLLPLGEYFANCREPRCENRAISSEFCRVNGNRRRDDDGFDREGAE